MGKVCLNIYKRKDGRYEGRYKKGRKEKKLIYGYVYAKTKAEAARKLLEKQREYGEVFAKAASGRRMTLGLWLSIWMNTIKEPELKQSSYAVYERQIRLYLAPLLGYLALTEIKNQDILGFCNRLREKGLAGSTIISICRLLRCALREAREQGLIGKLPGKRVWPKNGSREEARYLEERERSAVLRKAAERDHFEIMTALCTGLRLGEIAGLQWKDIDMEKGSLRVRQAVQRVAEKPEQGEREAKKSGTQKTRLAALTPKSQAAEREIPLVPELHAVLKRMWEKRGKQLEDYVFCAEAHPERPMDPRNIQRRFEKICSSTGIKNAHFHTLRHTFATICMERGFDVETVRYLMGHSTARITLDCYAHCTRRHRKEVMQKKFRIAM